jgi:pyruvate/2-oxoglutarate dehydrogenase complex dihydrolipoamide dehydrogenase (E3) component
MIMAEQPDVVVIATGASARPPRLAGLDGHKVVSAWDVLQNRVDDLGQTVLVIDEEYGHQGPTTAEFLVDAGKEVDLVTSQETIGNFLGATTRPPLLRRLFKKRVQIFNHLEAKSIENGNLQARNIWSGDMHEMGPYDSFVYAYGGVRVDELSEPLKARGVNAQLVGDAFAPRSLQHAILEGHALGREL